MAKLTRLQQEKARRSRSKAAQQIKSKLNKEERSKVSQGIKRPFYLKKRDLKTAELTQQYEKLKKAGKLDKYVCSALNYYRLLALFDELSIWFRCIDLSQSGARKQLRETESFCQAEFFCQVIGDSYEPWQVFRSSRQLRRSRLVVLFQSVKRVDEELCRVEEITRAPMISIAHLFVAFQRPFEPLG